MRRLFLLLCAFLPLTSCGVVRIAMDSHVEDGDRVVLTSDTRLFGDVSMALGAKISGKDTLLAVLVTYDGRSNHGVFEKGDRLMIRLKDKTEIKLSNIYQKEFEKEEETYTTEERRSNVEFRYVYNPALDAVYVSPVEVSYFVPRTHSRTITKSYALYLLTRPQLLGIIGGEVVKLRVEIENDDLDMPNTAGVASVFSKQYDCLADRLHNPYKRRTF